LGEAAMADPRFGLLHLKRVKMLMIEELAKRLELAADRQAEVLMQLPNGLTFAKQGYHCQQVGRSPARAVCPLVAGFAALGRYGLPLF
jgi:hypothetical protein